MFGKKGTPEQTANFEKIDTLIGKGTSFQGNIVATGTIRIDGEFNGDVKVKGDIVIGEEGKVEGTIDARNVLVGGYVKGNVAAVGKVDLAPTAKLFGDIKVKNLIVEDGAVFKGNCVMESKVMEKEESTKEKIANAAK